MTPKTAPNAKVYAAITGDVVGSTKLSLSEMKAVRLTIKETVEQFDAEHYHLDPRHTRLAPRTGVIANGVEFFQGDSWQIVLSDPRYSLRLALLIQAALRRQTSTETRIAIGIGTLSGLEKTAAISTGEALTLSGRALEAMNGNERLTGALPEHTHQLAQWFPVLLHLCGTLTRGWTKRQAEVLGHWLLHPHPTYEEIASGLGITIQSVGGTLLSANLPAFREALELFSSTDWQSIAGPREKRNA